MGKINQPSSQIKLTNVSLVRMKKGKKRFEIACYQNKVNDYRTGIEKDLDEVLQIPQVFTNVSKGAIASNEDLMKSFGTLDIDSIVLEILKKGEIQLSEKERNLQNESLHNEILTIISTKCVNPKTKKRYPPTMIDKALKELKFNMSNAKVAKIKALEGIKLLVEKQIIPIARAQMKLRILKKRNFKLDDIKDMISSIEHSDENEIVCLIEPEFYKSLVTKVQEIGGSTIEVLDMAVIDSNNNNDGTQLF
ncbi:hypothetical protein CANARDRAFT_30775 [[Candida] arabinofermentans NRRL YB-2248]|uniref:Ribosome maturation protein SDO1 n=1 Tax=[Candida] arabinofermentans NRRL YB-2248 TaxID=983967 RepID=A0A1E4SSM8_9ASCO|nr:hypothetical protein CANARDRAFT_30775 [[Candida] arabinofermentans NRRL YB-2248]